MKIACAGAGPAGLYLAILVKLRDPSAEISVYERNPKGVTHGFGIVFWDDLVADLRDNDPVSARSIFDHSFRWTDQVIDIEGRPVARGGGTGYGLCRRKLLSILADRAHDLGVDLKFEREVAEADGLGDADVIVAADGVGSRLRRHRSEAFDTEVAVGRNKYVWLGTSKVFSSFTFGVVATEAGWIWFHGYGYSPEMSTFIVECSPETWKGLGFDRMKTEQSLHRLESLFARHLDGHALVSHTNRSASLPWLNFRSMTNHKWHTDNVVLAGDSAHTTHFSIGSGARLAMQDAIALARNLTAGTPVPDALQAYETERQSAMLRPRREARNSAQWFENLGRYLDLEPQQLFALLLDRRSRLMPYLPPRLYYQLHKARQVPVLRKLHGWAAGMAGAH